jgi:hypothetical protein
MFFLSPDPIPKSPEDNTIWSTHVDRDTLSGLSGLLPESFPYHADQITFEYIHRIRPVKGQL